MEMYFYYYYAVTKSKKWSDRDIRKNKERVQELKVLWKGERLHSTINKYIETLIFTILQACCSQIVTFKILNSSPPFGVDRHFLYDFSFLPRAWLLPGMQISSDNLVRIAYIRILSIDESIPIISPSCSGLLLGMCHPRWSPDVLVTAMAQRFSHRPFIFYLLRYHTILVIS